jgi:hypothetical protein
LPSDLDFGWCRKIPHRAITQIAILGIPWMLSWNWNCKVGWFCFDLGYLAVQDKDLRFLIRDFFLADMGWLFAVFFGGRSEVKSYGF